MRLLYILLIFCNSTVFSQKKDKEHLKNIERQKLIGELDSFYDAKTDYSKFIGRTTDRDRSGRILKMTSENRNIKFFKTGDMVKFGLPKTWDEQCTGYVRGVEEKHFILYVVDYHPCWKKDEYFRRGTILVFYSPVLATRVRDASIYRQLLISKRRGFLRQLDEANDFIWSYNQKRILTAAEFDKKILKLRKAKQKSMGKLLLQKEDSVKLREELIKRVDKTDKDIDFYRIDLYEKKLDRWNLDHGLGLPVSKRPPGLKRI
ncbi:MAG: hypothetical protein OXB84_02890 [Halobacteriovoraceae bacterium]|nr:hypothetical protein [Halobacteriovoraceae bacterium]